MPRLWVRVWLCVSALHAFESKFVSLLGVRHHVRDTGDVRGDGGGPIAVLLHGFTGSAASWEDVAPRLAAGGVRTIAIDRVGFGRTERPVAPKLPAPPALPGREALASGLESLVSGGDAAARSAATVRSAATARPSGDPATHSAASSAVAK